MKLANKCLDMELPLPDMNDIELPEEDSNNNIVNQAIDGQTIRQRLINRF